MPWKETDVMGQRLRFLVELLQGKTSMSALCRQYGISRKTGYKWLQRYREAGSLAQLRELSRRPQTSPRKTPEALEERVVALRERFDWGGRKLSKLLAQEGMTLSAATVDRIIRRRGLTFRPSAAGQATKRFEHEKPNDLWQMDFKGQYSLGSRGACYPLSLLDDSSRFSVGLYGLAGQSDAAVRPCLIDAWERHGVPKAILTDRGTPWWSNTNRQGLTKLAVFILEQGVRLVRCRAGHPQSQGKVERFHRTLKRSLAYRGLPATRQGFQSALEDFRREYNEVRPHEALDLAVPSDRYQPSRRSYQASPAPWEFPVGADVHLLNSQGFVTYGRRRYFVCEALAQKPVQCDRAEERLLVSFRGMPIREVDLKTGSTVPVVTDL